ncbi:hypothetical protein BCR42DRAFT_423522 [Absidia repens]|uniref:Uncharacterized protein n=1 Tax=Absidia repens TaxID=90262 RepID=A0A1X2I6H7_9FUNG|nr:hypothetical protein BCR42DRAFT_423522 [Absidia repens]
MEYHEIRSFINQDRPRALVTLTSVSTINASTTSATTDGDNLSLGYSSDDSFDSYDTPLRQTSILEHQTRRYYQLPVSPLPQKKQHWQIQPPHSSAEKRESNSSLSKKFVQGVQSLKNKMTSFSPSGMSSTSEGSLSSSFASDEYHSLGPSSSYDHPYDTTHITQSEISTNSIPPVHPHDSSAMDQEIASHLSPIPNPNHTLVRCHPLVTSLPSSNHSHSQHSYLPSRTHRLTTQQQSMFAATHELLASGIISPTSLSSASKRSKVRKRLNSIWKRHLFKPASTPRPTRKWTIKNNHLAPHPHQGNTMGDVRVTPKSHLDALALPFEVSSDRSSQVSLLASSFQPPISGTNTNRTQSRAPATILAQVSEHIQKLQCLVDIEVQLVEDHQRDIEFYTNQLEQLDHDVQYLNHKVSVTLSNIENNMDPLQEDIQRTLPLLVQLHSNHQLTVMKFTNEVLRNKAKDTFSILQSKVKSAERHIRRWDSITFWALLISVVLLTCMFILWLIYTTGVVVTSALLLVLVTLFYDAS